jgi:hypothetical protein
MHRRTYERLRARAEAALFGRQGFAQCRMSSPRAIEGPWHRLAFLPRSDTHLGTVLECSLVTLNDADMGSRCCLRFDGGTDRF